MRRKDVMKKGTAWLLTATLLVGLLPIAGTPTTVQAETTTAKTIAGLGTSVIADPVAPSADTDEWKGSIDRQSLSLARALRGKCEKNF